MKLAEVLEQLPADTGGKTVYGEPFQTPDGATVVTVARVRAGRTGRTAGVTASPVGVFVLRDDQARWVPAVDASRVALIGVATGMLSALIAMLAVLRRPPWPDLRG
ncbi:MAG TPA: hypothetical protein VFR17_13215 [Mycobacterium sp.]|nr:hypothetical protein [Mycobacterium sp.]